LAVEAGARYDNPAVHIKRKKQEITVLGDPPCQEKAAVLAEIAASRFNVLIGPTGNIKSKG